MNEVVAITLTAKQRERLERLLTFRPDLGKALGISLIEDEVTRAVWNALPA